MAMLNYLNDVKSMRIYQTTNTQYNNKGLAVVRCSQHRRYVAYILFVSYTCIYTDTIQIIWTLYVDAHFINKVIFLTL